MNKLTTEKFIEKAKQIHGDKYDYSKVEYKDSHTKVCIICQVHGEFFQTPNSHLSGSGCPNCHSNNHKYTKEEFVDKANKVHNNKYDYSKVEYINNVTPVTIICPIHGEFKQSPANHLFGQGCPKCAKDNRPLKYCNDDIISNFIEVHGDKYDYSKVKYTGIVNPVTIICPEHGEFKQTPSLHINGCGCPKCGRTKSGYSKRLTTEEFIEKARAIHGDKYDYSKVNYVDYDTPVTIICPIHGEFKQTPDSHLQGKGCNSCSIRHSNGEDEIIEYIKTNSNLDIEINNRSLIKPYELDIYIPDKKIAIEYNGIRWHTEEFGKDKNYHLSKLNMCNENGVKLIQIFEDEFILHKDVVLNKISHILGFDNSKSKIFARKTVIKEINCKEAKHFLDINHIQGFSKSTVYIGCYFNELLVGVMSFKRFCNEWELNRFATNYHYICCGVGGKLLSYFIKNYKPNSIKSFADRRWTTDIEDNIYTKLGFKLDSILQPDYRYVKNNYMGRIHKFNMRKQTLSNKYNLDLSLTESEMTEQLGYYKIWDCGLIKYVL